MIDPIIITIFSLLALLFSVIIHELAHGYVAYALGDPTAKYEGRLTLNPLPHLDMFGSVLLPLILFLTNSPILIGWAKPVPVNPYNFKDQQWGSLKVSLAGPATNIAVALLLGVAVRGFAMHAATFEFAQLLGIAVFYNILLALFNLVPIPPLDGSWILFSFLPRGFEVFKAMLQQYGVFILIAFIFLGGLEVVQIFVFSIYRLVTGMPALPFF